MEIMLVTPRIQALIRRGELETIRQAVEERDERGPPDLRPGAAGSLFQERSSGRTTPFEFADSPNNLRLRMKGIK